MKNLTKKAKLITLAGALALVCVTCAVTMFTTGVLPSQSKGETDWNKGCVNDRCDCHTRSFTLTKCGHCPKCYTKPESDKTE